MARILVISPTPSHPQDAGNRARIFSLLYTLKSAGHLVYFTFVKMEAGDETRMAIEWDGVFTIPYRWPSFIRKRLWDGWMRLLRQQKVLPYKIDDWYRPQISERLADIRDQVNPDVVLVEYCFFSKAFECFGDQTLKILDTHDILGGRQQLFFDRGLTPQWFYTTAEEEKKGLDRADIVLAIQERETEYFAQLTNRPVLTVGHLAHIPEVGNGPHEPAACRLLFVGSANQINVDALSWFVEKVFPTVRQEMPGIELEVAGACANSFHTSEGVVLTGPVSDLAPLYRRATAVINPVRFGTGLKIKSIEALANELPLITTRAGASGLEAWQGRAFIVADTAGEFTEAIRRIWASPELRSEMAEQARILISDYNRKVTVPLLKAIDDRIQSETNPAVSA